MTTLTEVPIRDSPTVDAPVLALPRDSQARASTRDPPVLAPVHDSVHDSVLAPVLAPVRKPHLDPSGAAKRVPPARAQDERALDQRVSLARHFGVLSTPLLRAGVSDIFLSADAGAWYDRGQGLEPADREVHREIEVRALATRLIALGGRHIDEAAPCADVRLPGGVRVHAVLPPVAAHGTQLSVRVPALTPLSLDTLAASGFFGPGGEHDATSLIIDLLRERRNILISGPTGSGKTTLLAALIDAAPDTERVIAVEDVAELGVRRRLFISLQARQANIEGIGHLGLRSLVREALRMRPDRLILGECRGAEIQDLFSALNTGHDGGAGTIHANSLEDVPARLEALGALAGLAPTALASQAVSALDLVLHLRGDRPRGLAAIGRLERTPAGLLATVPVWSAVR
ncbi:CpaF family protein [Mycetocola saprophilus]|uniref:CpaF family protein n=1 Tax=Mycetocola saprophilus TaxID=76636 RepID=UPI0009DE9769|nr:ATPase, T2SS/T4P/T4SS family [Mycetocola saprophilus]